MSIKSAPLAHDYYIVTVGLNTVRVVPKAFPEKLKQHAVLCEMTEDKDIDISDLTTGDVASIAFYKEAGEYDFAVPSSWHKENRKEMAERGGAVWFYPKGPNSFRDTEGPVFMDELMVVFVNKVKAAFDKEMYLLQSIHY